MEEEVTSGCNEIQETLGPGTQGSQQGIKNVTKIWGLCVSDIATLIEDRSKTCSIARFKALLCFVTRLSRTGISKEFVDVIEILFPHLQIVEPRQSDGCWRCSGGWPARFQPERILFILGSLISSLWTLDETGSLLFLVCKFCKFITRMHSWPDYPLISITYLHWNFSSSWTASLSWTGESSKNSKIVIVPTSSLPGPGCRTRTLVTAATPSLQNIWLNSMKIWNMFRFLYFTKSSSFC